MHLRKHEPVSDEDPEPLEPAPEPLPLPHPDAGLEGREFVTEESRRIMRSSAVVAIGTALSRVTGFVRIAAIAYALGVSALAGTYSYANETPNIVYELLLGGVFTATLVPLFVKYFESDDEDAASAVATVSMLALLLVTALGVLFAPAIVRLYTLDVHGPGRAHQQELATELLRLFMPQMVFYGIVALATAMLNAQRRFVAAAFAPILNNVVVVAVFLMLPRVASDSLSVHSVLDDDALVLLMGLGTTAGVAVMALALLPALRRAHVHLRFLPAWRHAAVRTMLRVGGWTVGYVIANQLALFVVTVLAVGTKGGPFIYMAAYAFFQLPHGLFAVSLMTTFSPELARAATRGDIPAMRSQLSRALRLTTVVVVPAAALYIGLARPLIVTLLQRGAFSAGDASVVADTLVAFAVGLLPFSIYLFSLRAFTSRLDTFTPFWINCIENAINIALAFGFTRGSACPASRWRSRSRTCVPRCWRWSSSTAGSTASRGARSRSRWRRPSVPASPPRPRAGWSPTASVGRAPATASGARLGGGRRRRSSTSGWLGAAAGRGAPRTVLAAPGPPGPVGAIRSPATPGRGDDRDPRGEHGVGIRVVTDSACDLPAPLIEALGIEIVPLTIRFGDQEFVDRVELSADEFWERLERSDTLPETAAPSPGAFETCFRDLAARGATGIVCINLSSHLSGTMQAAQVAAAAVVDVCPCR